MQSIANNPDFTILDETEDYVVVNKPAPLQIHPKKPGGPVTLYDGLRELLAYEMANGGQVSIINRLDRETSGVVLIAKNSQTARQFGLAMQDRRFQKRYLAIAEGWPSWKSTVCEAPILRQGEVEPSEIWVKQTVHENGSPCTTQFRRLECFERLVEGKRRAFSIIEARPITGRMHQIRVHLSHLGHPILGDKIYGPDQECYLDFVRAGWTPDLESRLILPRHALHSTELRLKTESFSACWTSPLPDDLKHWIESSE